MTRCHSGRLGRTFDIRHITLVLVWALFPAARPAIAEELRGRVRDPHDRPVRAAEVLVVDADGTRIAATTRTGADGRFGPLDVPPGTYVILVVAPGLQSSRPTVVIRERTPAEIDVPLTTSAITESIVVSASQVETPRSRVTDSVTVEDAASLTARQVESVSEAIALTPGFGVIANGGRGALTSFFPRGGESDYTLVLVDGIPQNAFGGGFDAAHLSAADVERIEVVRGPQSALYGGGAIGGIVHVITRHGGPLHARGLIEAGSFGTWHATAAGSGARGPWSWGGSIDRTMSDGSTVEVPSVGASVSNDDYRRVAGSGGIAWSDRADRRLRFDLRASRHERGFPGPFGSDPFDRYTEIDTVSRGTTETLETAVSGELGSAAQLRHTAIVTFADLKGRFVSPGFTPGSNFESDDRTRRLTARYQADSERGPMGLSGGAEIVRERADNTFITGSSFEEIPIERSILGLFVEARPRLGDRLFVTTGVRAERIERRALDGDGFSRPTFAASTIWSVNPKISAAWYIRRPGSGGTSGFFSGFTRIRGGAGTGIKPPTVFEIGFTDNPDLEPERSRSVDIGIEQAFASGALVIDATWFSNRYDDLIVAVSSALEPQSQFRTDNIANARARGLELGVSTRVGEHLMLRGGWTVLDTEVLALDGAPSEAPAPFAVGDPLIRRPRHQGSLALVWTAGRASAFLTVRGRGRMADLEPSFGNPVLDSAGFTTTTIGGGVQLTRGIEIIGRVSNLFDREYEDALGFPALSRSAMVGLRIAAGR